METWQDVFKTLIVLAIGLAGAPIVQLFKNWFKWEDKAALALTGLVSAVLAVAELFLSGKLNIVTITPATFPGLFFMVFTLATVYYQLLKGNTSFFGLGGLLKKPTQ